MWKFIFSLVFFIGYSLNAQEAGELVDRLLDRDSLPKFRVRSVQFNANVLRLGENWLDKPRTSSELQVEVGIHKFFLVADFGDEETVRSAYGMSGNYWRTGIDLNLSEAWEDGNLIGLGVRYARASFSDVAVIIRSHEDVVFERVELSNPDLTARWAELVFKIKGKLYKNIYTGYTMRYQFWELVSPTPRELRPFDIPGFGKTKRPNSFQFDYYIGWRFSF